MKAISDLYDALCKTPAYAKAILESGMTANEMYDIAERLRLYGWAQVYYMPIVSFCKVKPLRFLLAHRQELLGNMGHDAFSGAYYRLTRFFISPLLGV